jgi:hypothetical protein
MLMLYFLLAARDAPDAAGASLGCAAELRQLQGESTLKILLNAQDAAPMKRALRCCVSEVREAGRRGGGEEEEEEGRGGGGAVHVADYHAKAHENGVGAHDHVDKEDEPGIVAVCTAQ